MKFKILQEDFFKLLSTALRFTSSKMQLPVLANILIKTEKGTVITKATNLEMSVAISTGAKVDEDGEITVPAKVITDLVSNLQPGQVEVEAQNEKIKVIASGFKSTVSAMNSSDFPKITDKISGDSINISSQDFSDALKSTLFSVSGDETRPILTGVYIALGKGEMVLVGTDGFRLSKKKIKIPGIKEEAFMVLPKSAITELVRVSSEEGSVNFVFNKEDNQVVFELTNLVLASRIIEGDFPDYEKIIPKSSRINISCDKEEFLRAVRLASVFAKDSANVIKFNISKDKLEIVAESGKTGDESTYVDAKIDGDVSEKLTVAFNYRFLEEFTNIVKGDDIVFKFTDANSAAIFMDPTDPEFLHIIMPIRLQS